jgi:transcriptional regulator with XRE-family HTH domain
MVRAVQKEKGWSNRELARQCRLSNTYVTKILNGEAKNLTIGAIDSLASGLEKPFLSVLLAAAGVDEERIANIKSSRLREALLHAQCLSEDAQSVVARVVVDMARILGAGEPIASDQEQTDTSSPGTVGRARKEQA